MTASEMKFAARVIDFAWHDYDETENVTRIARIANIDFMHIPFE